VIAMRVSLSNRGVGGDRLLEQMAAVLDPLAANHRGDTARVLRPVVAQAWLTAFHTELPEPVLSRCAAAISTGQPWQLALWSND
jgi:hypothetical protein